MKIIFEKTINTSLLVNIHLDSASNHSKISDKLFTHSEYDTAWSNHLSEWKDAGYFIHFRQEKLVGEIKVIIILDFIGTDSEKLDEFINKISTYLGDNFLGAYYVEYKSFDNE